MAAARAVAARTPWMGLLDSFACAEQVTDRLIWADLLGNVHLTELLKLLLEDKSFTGACTPGSNRDIAVTCFDRQ